MNENIGVELLAACRLALATFDRFEQALTTSERAARAALRAIIEMAEAPQMPALSPSLLAAVGAPRWTPALGKTGRWCCWCRDLVLAGEPATGTGANRLHRACIPLITAAFAATLGVQRP